MPRIKVTDATIEAVAAILAGNPLGLLLVRDELAAWLGNLAKYGEGDRVFVLEAYGARPYVVDRRKLAEPLRLEVGESAARDWRWTHQGARVRIARPPQVMEFNDVLPGSAPRTEEAAT